MQPGRERPNQGCPSGEVRGSRYRVAHAPAASNSIGGGCSRLLARQETPRGVVAATPLLSTTSLGEAAWRRSSRPRRIALQDNQRGGTVLPTFRSPTPFPHSCQSCRAHQGGEMVVSAGQGLRCHPAAAPCEGVLEDRRHGPVEKAIALLLPHSVKRAVAWCVK